MKRILFFVGVLSFVFNSKAQWKKINSASSQDLYGVQVLKTTVYAVGNNSAVLKSKDTGKSWSKVNMPLQYNLRALYFYDSLHGFVTGENARVMKTTNGGTTWTQQYVKTAAYANGIYFQNQFGLLVGNDFLAASSSDSGKTWNVDTTQLKFIKLRSVTMMPDGKCWAVGDSGYLLSKMVSSKKWQVNRLATTIHLTHITHVGNHGLIVVGSMPDTVNLGKYLNVMAISADSGKTWQQSRINEMRLINGAYFSHIDSGYLIGSSGLISKCNNGFSNRGLQLTGIASAFNSISMNDNFGVVVGDGGTIVRTSNSGGTPLLSIDRATLASHLKVYPNPSSGRFTISSTSLKFKIEIVDMLGKIVASSADYQHAFTFEIATQGVFTIRVQAMDGTTEMRLLNVVK